MDFLLTAKFFKIVITSALLFVLLDFLWLAVIASACYRQTLGYFAELDPEGKITFHIPFGLIAQVAISLALSAVSMLSLQVDNRLSVALGWGAFIGFVILCYLRFHQSLVCKRVARVDQHPGCMLGYMSRCAGWRLCILSQPVFHLINLKLLYQHSLR